MNVSTRCYCCCFRTNDENGNQNGCLFGRLEKFENVEQEEIGGHTSFIIPRLCNACRSESKTVDEVRREISVKVDVVVIAQPGTYENEILETVRSVAGSTLKPSSLHVFEFNVRHDNLFNRIKQLNLNFPFYVTQTTGEPSLEKINSIKPKFWGNYVALFKAGEIVPEDLLERFDRKINDDLEQIVMVELPQIVSKSWMEYFAGDLEFMKKYMESENCQHLILQSL